jgi:hypothetical protein
MIIQVLPQIDDLILMEVALQDCGFTTHLNNKARTVTFTGEGYAYIEGVFDGRFFVSMDARGTFRPLQIIQRYVHHLLRNLLRRNTWMINSHTFDGNTSRYIYEIRPAYQEVPNPFTFVTAKIYEGGLVEFTITSEEIPSGLDKVIKAMNQPSFVKTDAASISR